MFSALQLKGALPVRGHCAAICGKEILVSGGVSQAGASPTVEPNNSLMIINADGAPLCHAASVRGDIPTARTDHAVSVVSVSSKSTMYLFGGRLCGGETASNDLFLLDIDTLTWSKVAAPNAPTPRWGHSMVATAEGKLIVYGGTNGEQVFDDDFVFDTTSQTWSALESSFKPATGRFSHSAQRIGDRIFYFGGFGSDNTALTGPRIYDIVKNEWEAASPLMDDSSWGLPAARGLHASAVVNDKFLVISGGRSKPLGDKSGVVFGDVYLYDTESSTWQHAPAVSVASHSLSVVGKRVFSFGGLNEAEAIQEMPLFICPVEQLLTSVSTYMHDNHASEGVHNSEGKPKSRLRVLYEQERAQRVKLQARCALLENKLFNRSSAKQLSLELLVKQVREKDMEIAELKRKNEMLQRRFQSNASQEDQLREIATDLSLLWQRHEEHRRQREEVLSSLASSELAIKKQMQKFGAILGDDLIAPLTHRTKLSANNSAIVTANAAKRYSHNDASALGATSPADAGEKTEEYAKWLSSFNEKASAEKSAKAERISETQPDMKPLDLSKLSVSTPTARVASPRRSESAVSPRPRKESSELSISVPTKKDEAKKEKEEAKKEKEDSKKDDIVISKPMRVLGESSPQPSPTTSDDKKKKDKKTLSEQFLAGKATFSRRFSQITGKAKSLVGNDKKEKPEEPKSAGGKPSSSSKSGNPKKDEEEEGVWQPIPSPSSIKPLPLKVSTLDHCLEYLRPHIELDGIFRVSGVAHHVRAIYAKLESGDFASEENPHVVTGALKLYLRELEEPLIPFGHYSKTVAAMRSYETSHEITELKTVLDSLPEMNRAVLARLIDFLALVAANSATNRMDLKNLGIVFGPTLLRPAKETLETMMSDTNIVNMFTATLIEKHSELFPAGSANAPATPQLAASEDSEDKKRKRHKKEKSESN